MITNTYNLNMIPDRVLPLVMVSQYDSARRIVFNLFNGTEEYSPTSVKVLIGTNQYDGTVNGNQVTFNVPSELTQTAQYLFGEIVATDSNGKMGSLNFKFKVDSTPLEVIQTNTLTLGKSLSNGLKTALDLNLATVDAEPNNYGDDYKEGFTEEEFQELIEEQTKAYEEEAEEPIEEEPTEEPVEETEETIEEPIESEVEDGLVNDNTDN